MPEERAVSVPPFPKPTAATLAAIAARHGLGGPIVRMASNGLVNGVWAIGAGHVLRIPRDEPSCLRETRVEAVVAPAVAAVGVLGPRLVAWDPSCDLVPVPYTIWDRAEGEVLGHAATDPAAAARVWPAVAREIARFHAARPTVHDPEGLVPEERGGDPRESLAVLGDALRPFQVDWIERWIERLQPAFDAPRDRVLIHDDLHAMNLLVDGHDADAELTAILDWGDAGWGDPALEFACFPLRAVAPAVRAYREVAPLDDAAVGRIVGWHLATALDLLVGEKPVPPAVRWVELLRVVAAAPPELRAWLPEP